MAAGTILTIDDQPANLRLLTEGLEREGYQVVVALDGEEGIERAEYVRPDLILLDVQMPGIDGFETCRRLKARASTAHIPVVFMTALTETPDKLAGFAAGGVDYLTKPADGAEVTARIRTHLQLDRLRKELQRKNVELEQLAAERALSAQLRRLLDEREEMLRLLAHEVRQPLNNASAALESALAALGNRAGIEVQTPLRRAQQALDHVIGTLNNALAAATVLASSTSQQALDTDLDTLIDLVVRDIAPQDRPRVRVERHSEARTVRLQPVLMRLALCNLLLNALAYSPSEAPVRLRILDSDEPLALVFEVIDEGEGIPPELLPTLFDRGTRGSNVGARAGAGLGLYIVRKVVELHGGSVAVEANRPRGSVMRVVLPQGVAD
jgi:signal transduction histidine kinase